MSYPYVNFRDTNDHFDFTLTLDVMDSAVQADIISDIKARMAEADGVGTISATKYTVGSTAV